MRYPIERILYNMHVGNTRVKNIRGFLEDLGFSVHTFPPRAPGVDVQVYKQNQLVLVIEVTNWRISCYTSTEKLNSMNTAFRKFECKKLLMASFEDNYNTVKSKIDSDVYILALGYQTQPFFTWQDKNGDTTGMRPNDKKTKKSTKLKLQNKLKSMGLI